MRKSPNHYQAPFGGHRRPRTPKPPVFATPRLAWQSIFHRERFQTKPRGPGARTGRRGRGQQGGAKARLSLCASTGSAESVSFSQFRLLGKSCIAGPWIKSEMEDLFLQLSPPRQQKRGLPAVALLRGHDRRGFLTPTWRVLVQGFILPTPGSAFRSCRRGAGAIRKRDEVIQCFQSVCGGSFRLRHLMKGGLPTLNAPP